MRFFFGFFVFFSSTIAFSQPRDLTPNKKSNPFGKRDFRDLRRAGLQIQFGPTYLITDSKNEVIDPPIFVNNTGSIVGVDDPAIDLNSSKVMRDPFGGVGAYGEFGLTHFPKRRSKLSLKLKMILVSYYDWGVGFKYFKGGEEIIINENDLHLKSFRLNHGNAYARASFHKNININLKKTSFFLDNSLGINLDYRIIDQSDLYSIFSNTITSIKEYNPLHIQLHYGLGVGFKLKRGAYLIPGVRLPILGYQSIGPGDSQIVVGNPALRWFSSKYWPILFHIKYMFLFEKKTEKCSPGLINMQDKETQINRNK